ncbi:MULTISPECIES: hypothetical protein [unclassified Achromobacter]|uniref:hypothetical protein n=1 Tax=unclassified Achromobacter TaxID=2626865 RepID=UPI000B51713E|nr:MULTISPECIES: hypothetical protein [unclassified Achromobacter]OWT81153.1 hypothetical protein CEY05_05895 [Achromobacter sp. HZ34]OWT81543.1 hypothetical protein CEY04_05885 [Achromobacter sp. HZ28]
MLIVLPGALPASPPIADELAKRLPSTAPTLHAWLRAADARATHFDPHEAGCTPYEAWQLERAGFQPAPGQQTGAGLGPLLAGAWPDSAPVWIADLTHVALSTESANLLPVEALSLSAEEGAALFAAAQPLFEGTGFAAQPLEPGRWRIQLPDGLHPRIASPAAVGGQSLSGWWNQDAAVRPWRRLMNEIQMVWHDHPVNEARAERGLPPVNTLWLYGGAAPWPMASRLPASPSANTGASAPSSQHTQVVEDLLPAFAAEDWGTWLLALQHMDSRVFKPLSDARGLPAQPVELLLLGRDRRVDLTLKPRSRLLGWLPSSAKNWSAWWSPRA